MHRSGYKLAFKRIRAVLMSQWDPIGVAGEADAAGEYDAYVPQILRILTSTRSKQELVAFLHSVEVDSMELAGSDPDQLSTVAENLLNLHFED